MDDLSKKLNYIPLKCPFCDSSLETRDHMFFNYINVAFIWEYLEIRFSLLLPKANINLTWFL